MKISALNKRKAANRLAYSIKNIGNVHYIFYLP